MEIGEALQQRLHARRSEKDNHVVVERLVVANHVAHRAIHDCLGELDASVLGDVELLFMNVAHGVKIGFLVVLGEQRQQRFGMTGLAIENLALAVDDVFLQIMCNCLAHTEVLHCVGHIEPQFLAQAEVMVDSRTGSENHRSVVVDGDFGLSKFP